MSKNNSLNETSTWRVGRKENPVKDSKKKQVRRDTGQSEKANMGRATGSPVLTPSARGHILGTL